ncbi:NADP-dependent oxidoreductase [Actinoalloteichus hymeniacidonis]|uniref:Zn-dependent oxidoreductase, NADPH:quinone reductase n=1 Tax=Actinoalloteichus hymeniacidonis TaxID=340345 RepID=A0AAC9HQQ1_9PSEU|nr:NADP-dependent oxidoreductase [Actinoalloteichus hymeniacidonis]AOS63654.1 Zn-dependent oxidoreductase, NADPH:quinone reductase [Actinoalloteichus hymeniacidonis]MBB5908298.1 NADPH:quinone reductase-like Zn-dependent oxidoreductase [Actinoalloteichus hymeniacidonis]
MQSIQFAEYGGADRLGLVEVPIPEPGPGQVRVAVRCAGVNPIDWKQRSGAMADVAPLDLPHTPGVELSGIVDAIGEGVEFRIGHEVFGWSDSGSYAEYALATTVVTKPEDLSWRDAATLPVAGEAALRVLRLGAGAGQTLLIHGASGGVGSLATQLAVDQGATVLGVASKDSAEYVRSLGATPVIYGEGLVDQVREIAPNGVDAVFDAAGRGALPDSVTLRGGSTDRIVTIADPAAQEIGIPFDSGDPADHSNDTLTRLADMVVAGKLRIKHATNLPLSYAAQAQRLSETGHSGGKITLDVN